MSNRILLVEDDERIRASMRLALEDEGYEVDEAGSGEIGLEHFTDQPADVVLIDLMLPGIDGFECCRQLRRTSAVPVIMVTARNDTHDVVAGLEAGADDYVTKPFVAKELAARIRALLRRARSVDAPDVLAFGDVEVLPDEGTVRRAGAEVHCTRTEFRLLCELATNPGKVLSREQLLDRVWGYDYFGDGRLVDVHIRRLRTKIEADPANPRHILTVRGMGYKLASLRPAWAPCARRRREPRSRSPPPTRAPAPAAVVEPGTARRASPSPSAWVRWRCRRPWPGSPTSRPGNSSCTSARRPSCARPT